jgi:hypothetical protein
MNNFIRQVILRRNVMDVPCEVMLMEVKYCFILAFFLSVTLQIVLTKCIEILYRSPRSKDEVLKESEIDCIISHFTANKVCSLFFIVFLFHTFPFSSQDYRMVCSAKIVGAIG